MNNSNEPTSETPNRLDYLDLCSAACSKLQTTLKDSDVQVRHIVRIESQDDNDWTCVSAQAPPHTPELKGQIAIVTAEIHVSISFAESD